MGRVLLATKVEIGYLEQTAVSGSTLTVWEEARSRMTLLLESEALLQKAEDMLLAGECTASSACQAPH